MSARAAAAARLALALIILLACALAAGSWRVYSNTWDEPEHLAAGVELLDRGQYEYDTEHPPLGRVLLALGPSMANIIQFYGHRKAYGLSVSPNPLRRNPSYEPVNNPDQRIRNNELQYVVWDSFSAARTPFFSQGVLRYVSKYHGRVVHTEYITVNGSTGAETQKPVIVVYEVRP